MEKLKLTNKEIELINRFALKELNSLLDFCIEGRRLLVVQYGKRNTKARRICIKAYNFDSLTDDDYVLFVFHTATCSKAVILQKRQLRRLYYRRNAKNRYFNAEKILQLANSVEL
ncbi:MAG: hypothetical protein ABIK73_08635 [candidate division WOR-3 bacterium]